MPENKKVLCVGSFEEQLRVARIVTGLVSKLANIEIGDAIRISWEERELLSEIIVSSEKFK